MVKPALHVRTEKWGNRWIRTVNLLLILHDQEGVVIEITEKLDIRPAMDKYWSKIMRDHRDTHSTLQ